MGGRESRVLLNALGPPCGLREIPPEQETQRDQITEHTQR
jgi:hypothetical protein